MILHDFSSNLTPDLDKDMYIEDFQKIKDVNRSFDNLRGQD